MCYGQYLKDPEEDPGLSAKKTRSDQKAFIKTFLAIRISIEVLVALLDLL
jgi:hypothetical protein